MVSPFSIENDQLIAISIYSINNSEIKISSHVLEAERLGRFDQSGGITADEKVSQPLSFEYRWGSAVVQLETRNCHTEKRGRTSWRL
jgi:hypothetical protein